MTKIWRTASLCGSKLHFAPCSQGVIELGGTLFGSVRQVDML